MATESKTGKAGANSAAPAANLRKDAADRSGRTRAIGALLPGIAGEALGRRGFAEGTIFRQWREIVGADIAADCLPEKLGYPAGRRHEGTLQVIASGGAALELQHRATQIVERVNAYLGYGAIAHLKIRQGRLPARPRFAADDTDSAAAAPDGAFDAPGLAAITDPRLKEVLASFGHSVRRAERRRKGAGKRR
jgi:hypothetical protein